MRILLVPSCGIIATNKLCPTDTQLRCEKVLQLWNNGHYDKILTSGGIFLPQKIQTKPAALLMAEWLAQHGVAQKDIIIEDASVDTFENIAYAIKKLRKLGIENFEITIVTQWQHTLRFWISFLIGYGIFIKIHPMHYPISWKTWFAEWRFILYHLYDNKGTKKLAVENRNQRHEIAHS